MLESIKNSPKTVGIKQSIKALQNNSVRTTFIAKDAEEKVTKNIKGLCEKENIEIVYVDSMKQLGKACGIEVGAAVVCLLKDKS